LTDQHHLELTQGAKSLIIHLDSCTKGKVDMQLPYVQPKGGGVKCRRKPGNIAGKGEGVNGLRGTGTLDNTVVDFFTPFGKGEAQKKEMPLKSRWGGGWKRFGSWRQDRTAGIRGEMKQKRRAIIRCPCARSTQGRTEEGGIDRGGEWLITIAQ